MTLSNRLLGFLFIVLALSVVWVSLQLPAGAMGDPGSAVYPIAVAILILPLALILVFQKVAPATKKELSADDKVKHRQGMMRAAALLLLSGMFIASLDYLGVLIGTICFLWLAALLLGRRTIRAAAIYLVVSTLIGGAAYFIFIELLHLTLPLGIFF